MIMIDREYTVTMVLMTDRIYLNCDTMVLMIDREYI